MTEVTNLTDLRNLPITTETIYIKGYDNPGDGGGGMFLWRDEPIFQTGIYSTENYGTIIKSNIVDTKKGSWVRQYDGYINVLWFGALGRFNSPDLPVQPNYNTRIQNAIDFASLNSKNLNDQTLKGSTVFIPNGKYQVTNLILKSGVTILGESINETILYATEGVEEDYLFEMEAGVVMLNISNLNLSGNGTERGAFLFFPQGQSTSPFYGGLWNSRISNIIINGFKGHSIYLQGGEKFSNYLLPNQFSVFENVRVFNPNNKTNSLRMTGENGQITFLNCEFDGETSVASDVYTFKKGLNVYIENRDVYISSVISFINCTFQYADYGIIIKWAENVTIDNCWFEQLGVSVLVESNLISPISDFLPSKGISVVNNRFVNAAGFGSLNAPDNIKEGQCVNISNSFVSVNNNFVGVTKPEGKYLNKLSRFIVAYNNTVGGVSAQGNTFQVEKLGETFGILQKILVNSDDSIDCSGHRLVFLNQQVIKDQPLPNPNVKRINSSINAGEYLTIRADQGKVTFYNTDNIFFQTSNPNNSFTIDNGNIVTFVKIDNIIGTLTNPIYQSYQLVSIMREVN
jgi:Pectate lyase superfamily protein